WRHVPSIRRTRRGRPGARARPVRAGARSPRGPAGARRGRSRGQSLLGEDEAVPAAAQLGGLVEERDRGAGETGVEEVADDAVGVVWGHGRTGQVAVGLGDDEHAVDDELIADRGEPSALEALDRDRDERVLSEMA